MGLLEYVGFFFIPLLIIKKMKKPISMPTKLIAPCGMNCRLCRAFIRDKNICPGCRGDDRLKHEYCVTCKIKTCEEAKRGNFKYCFACSQYPCKRLRHMDKRYRSRYGMSVIGNLNEIQELGIRRFVRNQKEKWICPECGHLLCVHKPECISCGYAWYEKCAGKI